MKNSQILFLWKIIPTSSSLFLKVKKMEEENAKRNKGQVLGLG
jgi:hypothetical protein